ncbi:MAG: FAD-binding oxidoreductase, partial [Planctomycetota bacterium]
MTTAEAQTTRSPETLHAHARDLANAITGEVRFGLHDRMLYATDASIYQVEPLGVVVPDSIDDAVRTVRFCAQRNLPILPRGGGTSLAGQCTAEAVVLDLSAGCLNVLDIDPSARTCRVEAGITIDDLNPSRCAQPALRPRPEHRPPRHHRRLDRQQRRRQSFRALRAHGRVVARRRRLPRR